MAMNNRNTTKTIIDVLCKSLIVLLCVVILFAFAIHIFVWCQFNYIGDLVLYDGELLSEIQPYQSRWYFITQSGKGYVSGGYRASENVIYLNTEFRIYEPLGIPSPVLFYSGAIKSIYPFENQHFDGCLFINEKDELYKLEDIAPSKLFEGVSYAYYGGHSCEGEIDVYYIVGKDGSLTMLRGDNRFAIFEDGVRKVVGYNNQIYVLKDTGALYFLTINDGEYTSELINASVRDFDVDYLYYGTSTGFMNLYDMPLISLLTEQGELYVKGTYCLSDWVRHDLDTKIYYEWTLLSENVKTFSSSYFGTSMILNDGRTVYNGFDTVIDATVEFSYKELEINDASKVYTSKDVVCFISKEYYFIWGKKTDDVFIADEDISIFTDPPLVVDKSK